MADPTATTATTGSARPRTGSLHERVLQAMTVGLRTRAESLTLAMTPIPAGEPVAATSDVLESGETQVRYVVRGVHVATRTFRVDERSRSVALGAFSPEKYEQRYNGFQNLLDLHEQFVEHLAGSRCVLVAAFAGDDSHVWAPYVDWARDLANLNAAYLQRAVDAISRLARDQTAWDARDLSARVRLIAGPDPSSAAPGRAGSWRHLIEHVSPAQLAAGLDAINPHLSRAVFMQMGAWHGKRFVE